MVCADVPVWDKRMTSMDTVRGFDELSAEVIFLTVLFVTVNDPVVVPSFKISPLVGREVVVVPALFKLAIRLPEKVQAAVPVEILTPCKN